MRAVTVLGAGSWGTALAVHLARVGHDVRLWARDQSLVDDMAVRRANAVYLPDVALPPLPEPGQISHVWRHASGVTTLLSQKGQVWHCSGRTG